MIARGAIFHPFRSLRQHCCSSSRCISLPYSSRVFHADARPYWTCPLRRYRCQPLYFVELIPVPVRMRSRKCSERAASFSGSVNSDCFVSCSFPPCSSPTLGTSISSVVVSVAVLSVFENTQRAASFSGSVNSDCFVSCTFPPCSSPTLGTSISSVVVSVAVLSVLNGSSVSSNPQKSRIFFIPARNFLGLSECKSRKAILATSSPRLESLHISTSVSQRPGAKSSTSPLTTIFVLCRS